MWSIVLLNEREVVAVRRVGVFVLVDLRSQICVCGVVIYVDETPVGTVISPQIGKLPVHLSLGEVLL